jgi:hypothetical protein
MLENCEEKSKTVFLHEFRTQRSVYIKAKPNIYIYKLEATERANEMKEKKHTV